MENTEACVSTYMFRGIEYVVSMDVDGGSLVVEVEDRLTADQWRGSFDVPYIEDLTHKTGNFKQFPIFVNMLESALTQASDSVSLDLLTYSDLESLRSHKAGTGSKGIPTRSSSLNSKRYLILTYTVEFDRIHYPLPLPYMGKPDPRSLQETIRDLRQQVTALREKGMKAMRPKGNDKILRDYEHLLQEKKEIEVEFEEYKREVASSSGNNSLKELRLLKHAVKTLEEELLHEQSKNQRTTNKRSQEFRKLMHEVEELRASERNLKVRVKSLTNELAIFKRRGSHPNHSSSSRKHNSIMSQESSFNRNTSNRSNQSADSHRSRDRSRLNGSRERSWLRDRSSSRERSLSRDRPVSRDREHRSSSAKHSGIKQRSFNLSAGSHRSRTPSPASAAGARYPRFDPTAYIKEQKYKKNETDLKHKRQDRSKISGCYTKGSDRMNGVNRSRTSSVGSLRSRASSVDSLSDIGLASDSSESRPRKSQMKKLGPSNAWDGSGRTHKKPSSKKILSSTPESQIIRSKSRLSEREQENDVRLLKGESNGYFDRSAQVSEIDERLSRLQQFMKSNLAI